MLISYEVFFPERARAAVRAGAEVLLVPTNASWYRGRQVPAMQLAAARLRALETGRSVVQAGPTSYSAVIAASGEVLQRSALGPAAVLQDDVARRQGATLYARAGDAPVVLLAVVGLICGWRCRHRTGPAEPTERAANTPSAFDGSRRAGNHQD